MFSYSVLKCLVKLFLSLFMAFGLVSSVFASAQVDSINGNLSPPFLVWDTDKAGWMYTPPRSYLLDGLYATFRNVGAVSQKGPVLRRDVTVAVQQNNAQGNLLARGTFSADASAGNLGANFAPVLLVAGQKYFISYTGLLNLGLNIVDWNITAPSPQQPAGTVNLDGWYTGDHYENYFPQVINNVLQVFSAPILRFQGAPVDTINAANCLFNWAERTFPQFFQPVGVASETLQAYYYRHYASSRSYVGISALDNHVYYMGADNRLTDLGALLQWLTQAGC